MTVSPPDCAAVRLRSVEPQDLETFYEHQSDHIATAMAAFTSRDRDAFMAHWARLLGDPQIAKYAIECDRAVVGNIVSFRNEAGETLVGYWIGRNYWGAGIATRALRRFLDLQRHRPLHAYVAAANCGSIRVLEKCGFTRSGSSVGDDGVEEVHYLLRGQ